MFCGRHGCTASHTVAAWADGTAVRITGTRTPTRISTPQAFLALVNMDCSFRSCPAAADLSYCCFESADGAFGRVPGVIPGRTTTLFESGLPYSSGCT